MADKLKYSIGEIIYLVCSGLWQVSRAADALRSRFAHKAAQLQEDANRAKFAKFKAEIE